MILSDLQWLSKIFNDMKRRAVALRQLSFLFIYLFMLFMEAESEQMQAVFLFKYRPNNK